MQRHFVRFVLRVPPQNSSLRAGLRPFIVLKILARTILNRVQKIVQVKMVFDICFQYNRIDMLHMLPVTLIHLH